MNIRQASFAIRVVRRHTGAAAIVYRRSLTPRREERRDERNGPTTGKPAARPSNPPYSASKPRRKKDD